MEMSPIRAKSNRYKRQPWVSYGSAGSLTKQVHPAKQLLGEGVGGSVKEATEDAMSNACVVGTADETSYKKIITYVTSAGANILHLSKIKDLPDITAAVPIFLPQPSGDALLQRFMDSHR